MKYDRKHNMILSHECQLPPPDDILVKYIDSGIFINFRRWCRRKLIVSDTNPRAKANLKSSAAIRYDEARQLQYYYYMIHPFSDGRAYYEVFMIFVFLTILCMVPITVGFPEYNPYLMVPQLILEAINVIDVILAFFTGYYHEDTKKIILHPRLVAREYILGSFFFDALASFPVEFIIALGRNHESWRVLRYLVFPKLLRLITFIKYLDRYREWKELTIYKFKTLKLFIIFVLFLLWGTSLTYLIAMNNPQSWLPGPIRNNTGLGMLTASFFTIYNFMLIGYGKYQSKDKTDMAFTMVYLTLGAILQLCILAQMFQLLNKYNVSSNKYQQLLKQINEYIRYKDLPEATCRRIFNYFDFKFQKNYFKESEIRASLSPQLKQEIILHTCQRLVENVDFFKDLPTSLLKRIVTCMKSEIFLPNDVIVYAGTEGDSMYFISIGTVAIYTSNGKEICHLVDGAHFGEIALVMDTELRVASVVAVDPCELFSLSRKDFEKAIEPYPELNYRIKKLAADRLQDTIQVMSEEEIHQLARRMTNFNTHIGKNLDPMYMYKPDE